MVPIFLPFNKFPRFHKNDFISAKWRSPIKIASVETLSPLPTARRALPAAELPAELEMGAGPRGWSVPGRASPGASLGDRASRLTHGSCVWLQSHPCAPTGSCSRLPPTGFPSRSLAHTPHVCAHTRCPHCTPQPICSPPCTPWLTRLLPPKHPTRSFQTSVQRSTRSPRHRPGPPSPVPVSRDAVLPTSRGTTPWQVLSAPFFVSVSVNVRHKRETTVPLGRRRGASLQIRFRKAAWEGFP